MPTIKIINDKSAKNTPAEYSNPETAKGIASTAVAQLNIAQKQLEEITSAVSGSTFSKVSHTGFGAAFESAVATDFMGKKQIALKIELEVGKGTYELPVTFSNLSKLTDAFEAATEAVKNIKSKVSAGAVIDQNEFNRIAHSKLAEKLKDFKRTR